MKKAVVLVGMVALLAVLVDAAAAQTPTPTPSPSETTAPPPECSDGADNDGDGATDFPADDGCVSELDNAEYTETPRSPSTVTIRYDRRSDRFRGEVDSSLNACKVDRAVILYKARPGPNRPLWHASTGPGGAWRSRRFRGAPSGRFYAVVIETYVSNPPGYTPCLRDRSSGTTAQGARRSDGVGLSGGWQKREPQQTGADLYSGRFSTSLTIRYRRREGRFEGIVSNISDKCVPHVAVILKQVRPGPDATVWRASSNPRGRWRSDRFADAGGRFYALARANYRRPFPDSEGVMKCEADRSVTIRV